MKQAFATMLAHPRHLPRAALRNAVFIAWMLASRALAQEMEPRAYSASPVGTNFAFVNVSRLHGSVLPDPSVPITDVAASVDAESFGYVRTFGIAGHSASLGIAMPLVQADVSGNVVDAPTAVHRSGPGDLRLRFALGLIGSPALSAEEFARRTPGTSLGASLSVIAPTGRYRPERLVNVGSNRWAIKSELGLSQPMGNWFFDASAGVWLYGANDEYFGGHRREQDPLALVQLHAGYNFRPRMWLAADFAFTSGGRSSIDGVEKQDRQQNTRYGLTFSLPLGSGWSMKLAWARGMVTRAGGDYQSVGITVQHAWGDR